MAMSSYLIRWGPEFGARGRNRTGTAIKRRDFKSRVSTNFTTRATFTLSLASHSLEIIPFALNLPEYS